MLYSLSSLVFLLISRKVILNQSSVDHFININMLCPCLGVIGLVCSISPYFSFKESLKQLSLLLPPLGLVLECVENILNICINSAASQKERAERPLLTL